MKSYGLVIDGSLQPNSHFASHELAVVGGQGFPQKSVKRDITQSYSAVVEQSILTQDKPLLKEILRESDKQMRTNTVEELSVGRVSGFLGLLQEFLYEDSANTEIYSCWLMEVVARHVSVVLSNRQNRDVISRMRKFIGKRVSERQELLAMKSGIRIEQKQEKLKDYKPKFKYVQNIENGTIEGEDTPLQNMNQEDELLLEQFDD